MCEMMNMKMIFENEYEFENGIWIWNIYVISSCYESYIGRNELKWRIEIGTIAKISNSCEGADGVFTVVGRCMTCPSVSGNTLLLMILCYS